MAEQVIREVVVKGRVEGMAQVEAAYDKVVSAQGRAAAGAMELARVDETTSRRVLDASKAWDTYTRSVDASYRGQQQFSRGEALAARMVAQGASVSDVNRVLDMARAKYLGLGQANDNLAKKTGLAAYEMQNLSRQASDVATMLASGSSLQQVFATQAGQVYDILSGSKGGVTGALKDLAGRALGLVNPFTVAAAAAAAGAVAFKSYSDGQAQLRANLTGTGRATDLTAASVNRMSAEWAEAGKVSTSSAREMAGTFASTGRINSDMIGTLIASTKDYARVTGQDAAEAAGDLAKAFADPVRGADMLNERFGFLTDRTRRLISAQVDAGDRLGAQRTLIESLKPSLTDAAGVTNAWADAWTAVKNAASNAYDASGKAVSRLIAPTLDDRIASMSNRYRNTEAANDGEQADYWRSIRVPEAEIRRRQAGRATKPGGQLYDDLYNAQEDRRRQGQAGMLGQRNALDAQNSAEIGKIADGYLAEADALEKLNREVKRLGEAKDRPSFGMDADRVSQSYDRARGSLDSWLSSEEKRRLSDDLALRSINARTDAERAAIAVEQKRLELAGQALTADERRRAMDAARMAELARSERQARDDVRVANDNLALTGLRPFDRSWAEIDQRYRRDLEERGGTAGARADLARRRAAELDALGREAVGSRFRDLSDSLNEQAAALRIQAQTFGMSTEAVEKASAAQRVFNDLIKAGVPITADIRARVDEYATAAGKLAGAQEDLTYKQREAVGALDDVRSGFRSSTTGLFSDLRQGKNPLQSLQSAMGRMADQMFDRFVSGPLTEQLLGRPGQAGGGIFGGGLLEGFGKALGIPGAAQAVTTATMQVNAAVVNLGGASLGLPGIGSGANDNGLGTIGSQATKAFGLTGPNGSGGDYGVPGIGSALGKGGFDFSGFGGASGGTSLGSSLVDRASSMLGMTAGSNAMQLNSFLKTNGVDLNVARDAWCAAFVNANLKSLGIEGTGSNVANSFQNWGSKVGDLSKILPGDVLVESRGGGPGSLGGHVGIATGATRMRGDDLQLEMVSGNTSNAVKKTWESASSVMGRRGLPDDVGRQPDWSTAQKSFEESTYKAEQSLSGLGDAAGSAGGGLDKFGATLANFSPGASGGTSGGGGFGLGSFFGGGSSGGLGFGGGFDAMPDAGAWFANGGIMTSRGSMPLHRYAKGGIADSPQMAIFGEGRMHEAYVPLPDGRSIPVSMDVPMTPPGAMAGGPSSHSLAINDNRTIVLPDKNAITHSDLMSALSESNQQMSTEITRTMGERMERWRIAN